MSTRRGAIALAVIVSAISAGAFWSQRSKRTPAAVEPAEDASDDLRDEVRRLRSQVARLEGASAWQAAVAGQKTEETPKTGDNPAVVPKEHMPDELEYETQLEQKFQAEAHDPRWSREANGEATRALTTDLPKGSRLGAVDCRSRLCRVETSHETLQAFQTFVQAALLNPDKKLWNGPFSAQVLTQSASGVTAVTFIARQGESIPATEAIPD